jgi:hypothetical protein
VKLSVAIRLGALLKPQTFGHYSDEVGTCAMGAVFEAVGSTLGVGLSDEMSDQLDRANLSPCPVSGCAHDHNERATMPHLNDHHKWTRERIADWVQTIEDAEAAKAEHSQAVEVTA